MIAKRVRILEEIVATESWVAEYVYQIADADASAIRDSSFARVFLIDLVYDLTINQFPMLPENFKLKYGGVPTFEFVWDFVTAGRYYRITDGEPLQLLELAKVWLNRQYVDTFVPLLGELAPEQVNNRLGEIVSASIRPILEKSVTTDVVFVIKDLINDAMNLDSKLEELRRMQFSTLSSLKSLQAEFRKTVAQPAYDTELKEASFALKVKRRGELSSGPYRETSELDMWDGVKVDTVLPVCILNYDEDKTAKAKTSSVEKRLFKMHAPDLSQLQKYRDAGWVRENKALTIIMIVYIGEDEAEADNAPKEDFIVVTYSFKRGSEKFNSLTFTLSGDDWQRRLQLIRSRINSRWQSFEIIELSNPDYEISDVEMEFVAYGLKIDKTVFMEIIFSSANYMSVIRFNEKQDPWSQKKNLSFSVDLLGGMQFHLTPKKITASVSLVKNNGVPTSLWIGDDILSCVVNCRNFAQAELCRSLILKLLGAYVAQYRDQAEIISNMFPPRAENRDAAGRLIESEFAGINIADPIIKEVRERGEVANPDSKAIKQLRQADPEMWGNSNYAKVTANRHLQVMPIREDEIDYYLNEGRDVIKFPVYVNGVPAKFQAKCLSNPQGCVQNYYTTATVEPAKQLKRISLFKNKGPNSDEYPLLPKAAEAASGLAVNEDWEIKFSFKTPIKKSDHVSNTLRILPSGSRRVIEGSIPALLSFRRVEAIGMPRSPSSLIHCVIHALDGAQSLQTIISEDIIAELRLQIATKAVLCMQENPGKKVEEVAREIADPTVFLDPKKHYRAVEDHFKTNIFTLKTLSKKQTIPIFEVPDYSGPYIRLKSQYRNNTILVFKADPPKNSDNNMTQCDLVVGIEQNGAVAPIMPENTLERLEDVLAKITRSISVQHKTIVEGGEFKQVMEVHGSEMVIRDLPSDFREAIIGQHLDQRGKTRGLILNIRGASSGISIVTEAIEPFESPLQQLRANTARDFDLFLRFVSTFENEVTITEMKWTPHHKYANICAGVHFKLNNIAMFVPFANEPWREAFTTVVNWNPFADMAEKSYTKILLQNQRVIAIYIQLLKRLFVRSGKTPEDFVRDHMIRSNVPQHAFIIPNNSRMIPNGVGDTFESLLNHLTSAFPTFFRDEALVYDDEQFKQNMLIRLERFQKLRIGIADDPTIKVDAPKTKMYDFFPGYFFEFYSSADDFTVHSTSQKIFMSLERLNVETEAAASSTPAVVQAITSSNALRFEPYFYIRGSEAMFMIQNCLNDDVRRAATISLHWLKNKINLGYYTAIVGEIAGYEVVDLYDPNATFNLEVPLVFQYPNGAYAALLPIFKQ